jgi:hypothetical protein
MINEREMSETEYWILSDKGRMDKNDLSCVIGLGGLSKTCCCFEIKNQKNSKTDWSDKIVGEEICKTDRFYISSDRKIRKTDCINN